MEEKRRLREIVDYKVGSAPLGVETPAALRGDCYRQVRVGNAIFIHPSINEAARAPRASKPNRRCVVKS